MLSVAISVFAVLMAHKAEFSLKKEKGFKRRDFAIPNSISSTSPSNGETAGKSNEGNKKRTDEDSSLQTQMKRLQTQITKTTLEIDQLYRSVSSNNTSENIDVVSDRGAEISKEDDAASTHAKETVSTHDRGRETGKNVIKTKGACDENAGEDCCRSAELMRVRNELKLEKGVRAQMIRVLVKEKLENEKKTKVLRAILKYYHPGNEVLKAIDLSERLKRVIIAERVKLLPTDKQMEFAHKIQQLRKNRKMAKKARVLSKQ